MRRTIAGAVVAVASLAPGHCTGEVAFAVFRQRFQDHFDPAGLGRVLALP